MWKIDYYISLAVVYVELWDMWSLGDFIVVIEVLKVIIIK